MTRAKRMTRAEAKAQTRQALVDAAGDVFAERGYEAASVDELAAAAGYTIGALYAHFDGKEALFLEVIAQEVRQQNEKRLELMAAADGIDAQIEALVRGHHRSGPAARRSTLLMQEFWLYAARHAESRPELAEGFRDWQTAFLKSIARGWTAESPVRSLTARQQASLILALADGLDRQRLLTPEAAGPKTLIRGIQLLLGRAET